MGIQSLKRRYQGLTVLNGWELHGFKAQFHFINFIISFYYLLVLRTKPRALPTLKCTPSLSASPALNPMILGISTYSVPAWDFQLTFPEGISSLKCPEFLSFFGKHWSPVLNFVYRVRIYLKIN